MMFFLCIKTASHTIPHVHASSYICVITCSHAIMSMHYKKLHASYIFMHYSD